MGRAAWLAVIVVMACGCRAGTTGPSDATVDPVDLSVVEVDGDAAAPACALLAQSCGAGTHCYPFPFAEMGSGEARCATYLPPDARSPQCDSHVQCPGGSVCATLFGISTDCHRLCNIDGPACGHGEECIPLAAYEPAGLCL